MKRGLGRALKKRMKSPRVGGKDARRKKSSKPSVKKRKRKDVKNLLARKN